MAVGLFFLNKGLLLCCLLCALCCSSLANFTDILPLVVNKHSKHAWHKPKHSKSKSVSSKHKKYNTELTVSTASWDHIDRLVFNDNCTDCNNWLYKNGQGKGLAFLHMRKSGGTLFLRLLQEWFMASACVAKKDKTANKKCHTNPSKGMICDESTPFGGVHDGVYHTQKRENIEIAKSCRNREFRHYEYSCLHASSVASLPPINSRITNSFSLFTIMRSPLERHASQFFYVGPGERHVSKVNVEMCNRETTVCKGSGTKSKACTECMKSSTSVAMLELEKNETLWMDWITNSDAFGFGEGYMPNYYIHRLSSGAPPSNQKSADRAVAMTCFALGDKSCAWDTLDVLSHVALAEHCVATNRNMTESLELSKQILHDQFDFLILELMSSNEQDSTVQVLSRVFDVPYAKTISAAQGKDRGNPINRKPQPGLGVKRTNSSSSTATGEYYQNKMPKSVLELMKEQNALDIELYEYALDLFRKRFNIPLD
jgi:hypothetical protein